MALRSLILALLFMVLPSTCCMAAEMRGAWITTWDSGVFTPEEVDATIAASKKAGINALFIEVRKFADAYYDSKIEPRGADMAPNFDSLAYTIEKAHAEGIQVHAWVVVYRAWCGKKPGPSDPNHIINKHPDWVLLNQAGKNWAGEGMYLDPGVPEAREYILSVFEDIVRRYKIDGIQYDYVRYPEGDWGYSEAALKHFYADTRTSAKPAPRDPAWLQWKRDQVTAFVRMAHDSLKAINPKLTISASTICYGGCNPDFTQTSAYSACCQDWKMWMEKGFIDINIPMNYKPETTDKMKKLFRDWVDKTGQWRGKGLVFQGLDAEGQGAEGILKQVEYCRKVGQKGWVLFPFNAGKRRDSMVETLGAGLGPAPRLPVNGYVSAEVPQARQAYDRGIELATSKQIAAAKAEFKKAIELDPKYADAYFRLGRCYLKESNHKEAKAMFLKTLALDPNYVAAKRELKAIAGKK